MLACNMLFAQTAGITGTVTDPMTAGDLTGTSYKTSERLIQGYKSGDKRLTNDFYMVPGYLNQKGGFTFSTRYRMCEYNFVDYRDVPDDETALNPPSSTSAPVKNPK